MSGDRPPKRFKTESTLRTWLADERVDPNMTDKEGMTALMYATMSKQQLQVEILLADKRVDPNIGTLDGRYCFIGGHMPTTALNIAAFSKPSLSILKLLLADERTIRTRPEDNGYYYDAALAWANRQGTDAEAAPEELLPAEEEGDYATVASALRNPLTDPNVSTDEKLGRTILMIAAGTNAERVKILLADKGVDPNFVSPVGESAITFAAFNERCGCEVLEVLLADHRVIRTRPPDEAGVEAERLRRAQATYDLALRNVKQRRNSRFKGIIRAMGVFRRLRLRAAQTAYAPGAAGFAAAAASFDAAVSTLV